MRLLDMSNVQARSLAGALALAPALGPRPAKPDQQAINEPLRQGRGQRQNAGEGRDKMAKMRSGARTIGERSASAIGGANTPTRSTMP